MSTKEYIGTMRIEYILGYADSDIYNKCVANVEGRCNTDGFVIPGSLQIVGRTSPVHMVGNGRMDIHVKYSCTVGVFDSKDIIEVQIKKVTKGMGALASVSVEDTEIGNVILPDDIQEPGKRARENEMVNIRVLTSTFGYGWDMIRGVGQIV